MPLVSAVIPTIGRETLQRAVRSVQDQTTDVEIVVILDRPEMEQAVRGLLSGIEQAHLIVTLGKEGGARCRNIGTKAANGKFVAYLDDDDWWEPRKIVGQLRLLESNPDAVVCCSYYSSTHMMAAYEPPQRLPRLDESIGSYAVTRSGLKFGETCVQSSGIMLRRDDAVRIAWDASLAKHQDWDFVIRATANSAANLVWLPYYATHIEQGSLGSISDAHDWKTSSQWLADHAKFLSPRARADFAATHILRSALATRSLERCGRGIEEH